MANPPGGSLRLLLRLPLALRCGVAAIGLVALPVSLEVAYRHLVGTWGHGDAAEAAAAAAGLQPVPIQPQPQHPAVFAQGKKSKYIGPAKPVS